jgi:hypothetical protein
MLPRLDSSKNEMRGRVGETRDRPQGDPSRTDTADAFKQDRSRPIDRESDRRDGFDRA